MKKLGCNTTTYDFGNGYRVDIVKMKNYYEAWIYHDDYGVKSMMFGSNNTNNNDFLEMVDRNFIDYKELYQKEVQNRSHGL